RAPLVEASRLADTVPVAEAGIVVALGFGAGYHIAQLAERMGRRGLIVCFERDVGLLRAVLERVDVASALEQANVLVLTDPDDSAQLTRGLAGAARWRTAREPRVPSAGASGASWLAGSGGWVGWGAPDAEQRTAPAPVGGGGARGMAGAPRFGGGVTGVTRAVRTTLVPSLVQ